MPAKIVSSANAEHYTWGGSGGMACDAWYLVRGAELHVIEERMPAGASESPHHHERAQQFFFVLAGELTMKLEGEEFVLRTGEGIEIAPGQLHQAINCSAELVRFLVISRPPSHGDRIDA